MFALIFGVLVALVALVWRAVIRKITGSKPGGIARAASWLVFAGGLILAATSTFYIQDVGTAVVQRSITGEIVGSTAGAGLHFKAPWVEPLTYDTRNNTITYVGDGEDDHSGGSARGPQITFQDKEGVTANMDIVVRYSIVPTAVTEIYRDYGTQALFVDRVIASDVRSISRDIPALYETIELLNGRAEAGMKIEDALAAEWADDGIIVEEVNLQEIRYPSAVTDRFAEAQNSRIEIERAQADQERARVDAETARITAQGQADANAILSNSLTDAILQQRYIEALDNSNTVYVVPEGSQPLVTTSPGAPVGQ